jgi:hypothetical protein
LRKREEHVRLFQALLSSSTQVEWINCRLVVHT